MKMKRIFEDRYTPWNNEVPFLYLPSPLQLRYLKRGAVHRGFVATWQQLQFLQGKRDYLKLTSHVLGSRNLKKLQKVIQKQSLIFPRIRSPISELHQAKQLSRTTCFFIENLLRQILIDHFNGCQAQNLMHQCKPRSTLSNGRYFKYLLAR